MSMSSCPKSRPQLITLTMQTNPILGISFCMMTIRLQLHRKTTVVESDNPKPLFFNNVKATSQGHATYPAGSVKAQNQVMVFGSNQTVNDSTFDITASRV